VWDFLFTTQTDKSDDFVSISNHERGISPKIT